MGVSRRLWRPVTVAAALSTLLLAATGCEIDFTDSAGPGTGSTPAPGTGPDATPGAEEAADGEDEALLLIMDASGSMNATDGSGQTLLDGAKQALRDVVETLPDGQPVGLRVYGHRFPNTDRENGCQDTELIHPVTPLDRPALLEAVDGFEAVGFTPIGLSLQEAANDLPAEGPRSIILVSDGEDTCAPPEPCDVAAELAADGIDLVIHTVGFALGDNDQARQELECIADAGGGEYRDVDNSRDLTEAITEAARDRRQFEAAGDVLEGAPVPRDAPTGQVNTTYSDTVLGGETNFYRFEIPPGSEVRGELIVAGNPDARELDSNHGEYSCPAVSLRDIGDQRQGRGASEGGRAENAKILHTSDVTVDAGEVYLRVRMDGFACLTWDGPDVEFDIEVQLTIVG